MQRDPYRSVAIAQNICNGYFKITRPYHRPAVGSCWGTDRFTRRSKALAFHHRFHEIVVGPIALRNSPLHGILHEVFRKSFHTVEVLRTLRADFGIAYNTLRESLHEPCTEIVTIRDWNPSPLQLFHKTVSRNCCRIAGLSKPSHEPFCDIVARNDETAAQPSTTRNGP